MNIYNIMILGISVYIIISILQTKYFEVTTIIFILIISFVIFYYMEKDGFKDIDYKIEKLGEICLNNEKGFLYTDMCDNKIECAALGNIIAYRDSPSFNQIQAVYFNPYQYQNECNKDDSKAIIDMLNGMKKDFTILIN